MDRVTRKANLKKLQLPKSSDSKHQRTTRQSKKTSTQNTETAISSYFLSPRKPDNLNKESKTTTTEIDNHVEKSNKPSSPSKALEQKRKRTKLDAFVLKDPKTMLPEIKKDLRKSNIDDDFVVPEKKVKRAPKLASNSSQTKSIKSSKKKVKQTTLKSAFLRNEQMFAEIAALHCAADQFDGNDVQLALAISKSEIDCRGDINMDEEKANPLSEVEDIENNADLIREKLKKYGFRTAERKDYNSFAAAFLPKGKRLKSKWANKFTPLTLRQTDIQLRKLQSNIESLLNNQFYTKPLTAEEQFIPPYELQSSLLKRSIVTKTNRILQSLCSENQPNKLFFVKELFEINVLPAGYLLKDWSAIQGRDSTPKAKSHRHEERIKKLETIYHELETYFSSRKCLNWTETKESLVSQTQNENEEIPKTTGEKSQLSQINEFKKSDKKEEILVVKENAELNEMVKLLEDLEKNNLEIESDELHLTTLYDKKTKALLPPHKSLDKMEVSSYSLNTQTTFNTTDNTRSTSPDLFADSDNEKEEEQEQEIMKAETVTVLNSAKKNISSVTTLNIETTDKSRNNSLEVIDTDVMTYEVFSSEDVKNTPLLELNKSPVQEFPIPNKNGDSEDEVIDLTQDECDSTNYTEINYTLNQSKPIEEIDLFAESPHLQEEDILADINSNSESGKPIEGTGDEALNFTLNMETNDTNEAKVYEEDTSKLSLCTPKEKYQINDDAEDDLVLREIVRDASNSSLLNIEATRQMETTFRKETGNSEKDVFEDAIRSNDTIFRELCEKYLKKVDNTSMATKHKMDFEKSFSQPQDITLDFDASRKKQRESFTQFSFSLTKVQSPHQNINEINFTMDFDMSLGNNLSLRRNSNSFTVKKPKGTSMDCNTVLLKSHSFNHDNQTPNTDLTQQLEEDIAEDDDEGLMLSDDEINYSIWQANKTGNFQTSEQSDMENDIISISDADSSGEENKDLLTDLPNKDLVQLIEKDCKKSLIGFPKEHVKALSLTDFEKSPKLERESHSDLEISTSKYNKSGTSVQEEVNFDRSEFGILEEYSQPIDFTPNLPTPTKLLMEASFLNSPTEKALPMNRSSEKFKKLLNSLNTKSPSSSLSNTITDFDEFDQLVYTSSLKTQMNSIKQPQGIEKLLTAEISFSKEDPAIETPSMSTKYSSELQEIKCNNKTYTLRYDYTPKPDYTQLGESELLKQLYNYGIKPLKRKQAIKMLEYIYNQTHPILTEEEAEKTQNNTAEYSKELDQPCTSKSALESECWSSKYLTNMNSGNSAKEAISLSQTTTTKFKLNLQDSCGQDMLLYSNVLKAELFDECYILQTNVTKKTVRPLLPFHIAWYNLVCSNRQLHETILMYEPIDLQEIYLFLKGLGYRYEPKDMKTFFDRRCIIFRYDLTPPTKAVNRHVRKSKNKKLK